MTEPAASGATAGPIRSCGGLLFWQPGPFLWNSRQPPPDVPCTTSHPACRLASCRHGRPVQRHAFRGRGIHLRIQNMEYGLGARTGTDAWDGRMSFGARFGRCRSGLTPCRRFNGTRGLLVVAVSLRWGFWHRSWGAVAERYLDVRLRGAGSCETAYALASGSRK
jgi:hypothetical protein